MRPATLYVRMSQDKLGDGAGIERQEAACRQLCERLGLTVGRVHADNSISASTGARRPAFEALLAESHPGDVVVVWALDRLARRPKDLERILDAGLVVHAVQSGELDLSTPAGRAVARTVVAWASFEVEHKAQRQRAASDARAAKGLPRYASRRPFGYEPSGLELRESEAALIRDAYESVLQGEALASIARRWTASGVPPVAGGNWFPTTVRKILLNPRNGGLIVQRGQIVEGIVSAAPAVVPLDVWKAVETLLRDPKRDMQRGKEPALLTGIATCGRCGGPVNANTKSTRRGRARTYVCRTGKCFDRDAVLIEDYVVGELLGVLGRIPALWKVADSPDLAPLRTERSALVLQREQLASDVNLPLDVLTIRVRALDERLVEIDAELASHVQRSALVEFAGRDPRVVWQALPGHVRRSVLRESATVKIYPRGNGGWTRPISESVTVEVDPVLEALADL